MSFGKGSPCKKCEHPVEGEKKGREMWKMKTVKKWDGEKETAGLNISDA